MLMEHTRTHQQQQHQAKIVKCKSDFVSMISTITGQEIKKITAKEGRKKITETIANRFAVRRKSNLFMLFPLPLQWHTHTSI